MWCENHRDEEEAEGVPKAATIRNRTTTATRRYHCQDGKWNANHPIPKAAGEVYFTFPKVRWRKVSCGNTTTGPIFCLVIPEIASRAPPKIGPREFPQVSTPPCRNPLVSGAFRNHAASFYRPSTRLGARVVGTQGSARPPACR